MMCINWNLLETYQEMEKD